MELELERSYSSSIDILILALFKILFEIIPAQNVQNITSINIKAITTSLFNSLK